MKKLLQRSLILPVALLFAGFSNAEFAIIVHPSNTAAIAKKDIVRLFLGETKRFADGGIAIPVNNAPSTPIRKAFNRSIAGKSDSQMKAYWSTLVFTGKGDRPIELGSDREVIDVVGKNPSVIGYVDKSSVDSSVKVIMTFD